ncbi:hypothetical protein CQ13_35460 [Bradyrhizobium retamae]|uniref:Dienelactone hydrolase domain-containing protein n=1 Tax=Bradyrhizobium retamae TaxID=1300035 RepID=A0A0R3MDH0_9BRAD|nr:hypothetical protein CQ13_35460 [Bradyrhizobium retamae]
MVAKGQNLKPASRIRNMKKSAFWPPFALSSACSLAEMRAAVLAAEPGAGSADKAVTASIGFAGRSYGNALHGFTNPAADGSIMRAALYNEQADRRSWASMISLFDEVLT